MLHTDDINKLHVNIIMLHVNIIMLRVDIVYFACRGRKYATIDNIPVSLHL